MIDHVPVTRRPGTIKPHDRSVEAICRECSLGCGLVAYVRGNDIVDVQGNEEHFLSRGGLCARGLAFVQGLGHPDRLMLPVLGGQGGLGSGDASEWDRGLDLLADRLRKVGDRHGRESLAIGCDPEAGLDFHIGARRFARLWGTPHVYHPLEEPERPGWPAVLDSPSRSCLDWPRAGCLLLVEADPAVTHPVIFRWILEARDKGAKIVVADACRTATMAKADRGLPIRPASGNLLGLGLMKILLKEECCSEENLSLHLRRPESWRASFDELSLEDLAAAVGLSMAAFLEIGRLLGRSGPVAVITGKRLAFLDHYPIWLTMAAAAGWLHAPGGGWRPMESGRPPLDVLDDLPAAESAETAVKEADCSYQFAGRSRPVFQHPIQAVLTSGNCLRDFLAPFRSLAGRAELTAHFGAFPNETCNMSQMVFPAALWPECEAVVFGDDRDIHWSPRIVDPPQNCRTGLEFWAGLAARFGWEDHFPWLTGEGLEDRGAFYDWLLGRSPWTTGLTTEELRNRGSGEFRAVWPYPNGRLIPSTPPVFPTPDGKLDLASLPMAPPAMEDDRAALDFPLFFQATRTIARSGESGRWRPWLAGMEDEKEVRLNPETAGLLGIENGDEIIVAGPRSTLEGRVRISRTVPARLVWSSRRMGEKWVLVYPKDGDPQEALNRLRGLTDGA